MKTLSLKMSEALANELDASAKKRGVSKSLLVREAVAAYLCSSEPRAGSCYDEAKDLLGCLEGPADLSTNKKHLEGFGS